MDLAKAARLQLKIAVVSGKEWAIKQVLAQKLGIVDEKTNKWIIEIVGVNDAKDKEKAEIETQET
jgi:hypothetical protein